MKISRNIEAQVINLLGRFPVTGIIGPRQVGKTTLAKQILTKVPNDSVYLDLELDTDLNKLREPQLFLEHQANRCVVLDEIQRLPSLFPLIRALVDQNRIPGRFLILGSASPSIIRYSSESLAGRIAYQELTPFNLLEVDESGNPEKHWLEGGFPEAYLAGSRDHCFLWMQNFIKTYLERDLRNLGLDVDPVMMRRFWSMLAQYHGNLWNASTFAKSLGLSVPTVNRYLNFLEGAFIVRQLRPFHINIGKRLVKSPKVYFRDSGMLHYLADIQDVESLMGHYLVGHSWEGYVIEQIVQLLPENIQAYFYRTYHGAELDCVLVRGNSPEIGIEVKFSSSPQWSKGCLQAAQDLGTRDNYIIMPGDESYPLTKNVSVCGIREFLIRLRTLF